jgi:hypothetical protein
MQTNIEIATTILASLAATRHTVRSAQDLCAERRCLVLEQSRETDATARAMLQFEIDQIDDELATRR